LQLWLAVTFHGFERQLEESGKFIHPCCHKVFFYRRDENFKTSRAFFLSLHFDFWIGDATGDDGENDWDWCLNAEATLLGHMLKGRYLRNNCQVLPVLGQSSNMKIVIKPDQKLWQIGVFFPTAGWCGVGLVNLR